MAVYGVPVGPGRLSPPGQTGSVKTQAGGRSSGAEAGLASRGTRTDTAPGSSPEPSAFPQCGTEQINEREGSMHPNHETTTNPQPDGRVRVPLSPSGRRRTQTQAGTSGRNWPVLVHGGGTGPFGSVSPAHSIRSSALAKC